VGSTFALRIWSEGATAVGTFRPGDSEPAQVFDHGLHKLGATALLITGDVTDNADPIAFCADTVAMLPTAAALATPATFARDVRRMDYTTIPVTCVGPTAALRTLRGSPASGPLDMRWRATATLDADRDSTLKSFGGTRAETLAEH